jgi:hypothetical protein
MAVKDTIAVRDLLNELVKHRRKLIAGWAVTGAGDEKFWDTFTRLQSIIETLHEVENEEKSLP